MWSYPPIALSLESGEVHVWRVQLDQPLDRQESLLRTLFDDEHLRANRFHFEEHRRRFVVARGVLRYLLGRYVETQPEDLRFAYGAYGKPALDGEHRNSRFCFNASHSRDVAVYAFANDREIGIDVEYIDHDFASEEIARRFFSASEVETLLGLPVEERVAAFFRCWTRKEAFIKAIGSGLSHPLDEFDVTLAPGEPAELLRVGQDSEAAACWSMFDFEVGREYTAALAVERPVTSVSFYQFNL